MINDKTKWLLCPICQNKTRIQLNYNTELKLFPLFCPKCKQVNLINVTRFKITIIREPDAKTQSQ